MNLARADPGKVKAWLQAAKVSREAEAAMNASGDDYNGYDPLLMEASRKATERHFDAVFSVIASVANNCTCKPLPHKEDS